jgi:mannose-6-phosphate isomerase-like protein (cupin superfamily)
LSVTRSRRPEQSAYRTLDGSEIRELMHPDAHPVRNQSLAEAIVAPGERTRTHRHHRSEELYHILEGQGVMSLSGERFETRAGDTILIPPGAAHCIENTGPDPLRLLCCCAPAYAHSDTEIIED